MSSSENEHIKASNGDEEQQPDSSDDNLVEIIHEIADRLKEANCSTFDKLACIRDMKDSLIMHIQEVLSEKSYESRFHNFRMQYLALEFGDALDLTLDELDNLLLVAALHDIGNIVVPGDIINKPDRLTQDEWDKVKTHCDYGFKIALSISVISHLALGILHHHERWDGNGYPDGLVGKDIPFISRIIAIIDAYDAMTSDRPYRKALDQEQALEELMKFAGTQFDPQLTKFFVKGVVPYMKEQND